MRTFFTSDTHFNHANVIKYCDRPFASVEEMNHEMIARWNAVVRPEDVVFHLGDFALGKASEWPAILRGLNGAKKILILGTMIAAPGRCSRAGSTKSMRKWIGTGGGFSIIQSPRTAGYFAAISMKSGSVSAGS